MMEQRWARMIGSGAPYLNIIVKDWSSYVLIPAVEHLSAQDVDEGWDGRLPPGPCKIERPLKMHPWEKNPVGWHFPGECPYHDYVIRVDWDLPYKEERE